MRGFLVSVACACSMSVPAHAQVAGRQVLSDAELSSVVAAASTLPEPGSALSGIWNNPLALLTTMSAGMRSVTLSAEEFDRRLKLMKIDSLPQEFYRPQAVTQLVFDGNSTAGAAAVLDLVMPWRRLASLPGTGQVQIHGLNLSGTTVWTWRP